MKKLLVFILSILLLSSCATVFNTKKTTVKISADHNSKIIYQNDTLTIDNKQIKIRPLRAKKHLKLTVLKDSLKKEFSFKNKISKMFWLNVFQTYGIGMLLDLTNDKRFTYKHNIHFVIDSVKNDIIISNKKIAVIPQNKIFIYTTPLLAFDLFSIPMTTLGFEYFVKNNISISGEYGALAPNVKLNRHFVSIIKEKANVYRFETKLYNKINLTRNVHSNEYFGLEIREIHSQYNDYLEYYKKNDELDNHILRDDFATKKRVTVVNLKYGLLVPFAKIFYFDFYTGLGLRIKRFNHTNQKIDFSIYNRYEDDIPSFLEVREYKNYARKSFFNLSLGFKFGIKF